MNEVALNYTEKDLLVLSQQIRLLKDKELSDNKQGRKLNNKEGDSFQDRLNNFGRFLERNLKSSNSVSESIKNELEKFNGKNEKVMPNEEARELIKRQFENDKYGLARLLFSASIILDDEYSYQYVEEGLEAVSTVLFEDSNYLPQVSKQLGENYRAVSLKSLTSSEKGALAGIAGAACLGLAIVIAPIVAVASVAVAGVAAHEVLIKNKEKIKEEFKKSNSQNSAFYLALQLTYIQRIKDTLGEDEFKEELDSILKNVEELKSDLDYYVFVEKEATKDNREKIKAFNEFDRRLLVVLGIDK